MKIHEAPWQRRFRKTAGIGAGDEYTGETFTENPISDSIDDDGEERGNKTMPYPGYGSWTGGSDAQFAQYDPKFYIMDEEGGRPKKRTEEFDLNDIEDTVEGPFEDTYPVNP